jgi:DNA-binding transcriptional ArsR family regulator
MINSKKYKGLLFACECVSAQGEYSDPWAGISQNKLLPDGTKESILNSVAREPKTIAQLASDLGLSQPSIHRHIGEMMASELLRESKEWERKYPTERYYEPNFPVVRVSEQAEFEAVCQEMAARVADLFEKRRKQLENAFDKTDLANRGWTFADIAQYLYASAQRGARELLEQRGALPSRKKHQNGVEWIFWAEEASLEANE